MWPMLQKYVDGVKNKKIRHPAAASYERAAQGDPLIVAKLQFFFAISRTFSPFLLTFQTDEPVMPFLAKDLAELLKALVLNLSSRHFRAHQGAEQERVHEGPGCNGQESAGEKPLKCPVVRHSACLDPTNMSRDPEWGIGKERGECDVIVQQSERFLCVEGRGEGFLSFSHLSSGSMFSCTKLSAHPELRRFCQSLPLLSHGQATVERGFSVNKEVETVNLLEGSLEAQGCSATRMDLDQQQKKRPSATLSLKRRAVEDELDPLKKKREILKEVCGVLQKDADPLAEQAEGKAGSLMAQLLTKSSTLRRRPQRTALSWNKPKREWTAKQMS
ncbi:hypothetical protein KUCAC02_026579 [Chaenocephalus aceratus]|nr:hypothetical protein KUCAC02_026579 [Chaenocephalus aceratus]